MGAEPVWCLFRVQPQDSAKVKKAFNKAIKQSKIAQKLQGYLQSRDVASSTSEHSFPEMLREFYPQAFANISDTSDFLTGRTCITHQISSSQRHLRRWLNIFLSVLAQ